MRSPSEEILIQTRGALSTDSPIGDGQTARFAKGHKYDEQQKNQRPCLKFSKFEMIEKFERQVVCFALCKCSCFKATCKLGHHVF